MKRPPKYRAIPTEVDGFRFASKKEAAYFSRLKMLKMAGEVSYFLMQVPFHLPGKTKYICDFMVVYPDGRIEYIDVKGVSTPVFKIKKRQTEELYPVEIVVV